jgi:hypothetical protein
MHDVRNPGRCMHGRDDWNMDTGVTRLSKVLIADALVCGALSEPAFWPRYSNSVTVSH